VDTGAGTSQDSAWFGAGAAIKQKALEQAKLLAAWSSYTQKQFVSLGVMGT
jgi:hypothetical protein